MIAADAIKIAMIRNIGFKTKNLSALQSYFCRDDNPKKQDSFEKKPLEVPFHCRHASLEAAYMSVWKNTIG
jgi:hypothetical protein